MSAAQHPVWRPGDRLIVRGSTWHVLERSSYPECEALRLRSGPAAASARTILLPFDRPRRLPDTPGIDVVGPRAWGHHVIGLAAASEPAGGLGAAAHSAIALLPYQLEPPLLMRRDGVARMLIADGVGLGKTIQGGLLIKQLAEEQADLRALAVVPAGLRDQWTRELRAHFGIESTLASSGWLARMDAALPGDVNPWSVPGIYVTSMDLVKRPEVLRPLEGLTWDLVIVDEAHAAAAGTARRAAIHAVARRSRRVVLLTATPHSGDVEQFAALCRIGAADGEAPIVLFRRTRADVGRGKPRRTSVLAVRLSAPERRLHRLLEAYTGELCRAAAARGDARARLVAIVLRKRALSSAASLAQSCMRRLALLSAGECAAPERQMSLPLDDEDPLSDREPDSLLGAPGLPDLARERRRLTQIAATATDAARSESKVRRLVRLLRRVKEPAIVFTEYRDTLERLLAVLSGERDGIEVLHGGMRPADRVLAQRRFNSGAASLLLATDAASEGLNLHERCRLVVHFELPWSPARLEQRAGRVDRIGQANRVHEILVVASDTAERLVLVPLLARASRTMPSLRGAVPVAGVLSESHIAAAVLDNAAAPGNRGLQPASNDFVEAPAALRDEAIAEALRLTRARQCLRARRRGAVGPRVAATYRRRFGALPPGAVALYSLHVAGRDGRIAHGELAAVHCRLPAPPSRSAAGVRGATERYISTCDRAVREFLQRELRGYIDAATSRAVQASRASARRERAILESIPSAALELVQAGLFDQRAQRASADRRRAAAILFDDSHRRLDDLMASAQTELSWQLRALMFIGMGPRR